VTQGEYLAVGGNGGTIELWDPAENKLIRTYINHTSRVGTLAWGSDVLTSGSRDRLIYNRDIREPREYVAKLIGHKQEVCGLKWAPGSRMLASGGNDNQLLIWDAQGTRPLYKFAEHTAAVKAIAWSYHQVWVTSFVFIVIH
jgi:cell division cycle 20-like protein 1 (cofactor of APC complex)